MMTMMMRMAMVVMVMMVVGGDATVDGPKKITDAYQVKFQAPIFNFAQSSKSFLCIEGLTFCLLALSAQPKGNIEIWRCGGDSNTAGSWFHRPSRVRGRGCSLAHIQAAAYHCTREDLDALVRKSLFSYQLIPNSMSFSITVPVVLPTSSHYLIPITCVFSGKRRSGVCKRRYIKIFFLFLNVWNEQTAL